MGISSYENGADIMAAYIVVTELSDESSYAEQRGRLAQRVEAQGGRYLVSGVPQ